MVKMLVPRYLIMSGLAFTLGLFVGLCFHLPGVSSPSRDGRYAPRGGGRDSPAAAAAAGPHLRQIRAAAAQPGDRGASASAAGPGEEAAGVNQSSQPVINNENSVFNNENASSSSDATYRRRLREKMRAIEAAHARIRALKSGARSTDGRSADGRSADRDNTASVGRAARSEQTGGNSGREGAEVFIPPGDERVKDDPDREGARKDRPAVYGSRTVSVMVGGGLHPPPPPSPADITGKTISSHGRSQGVIDNNRQRRRRPSRQTNLIGNRARPAKSGDRLPTRSTEHSPPDREEEEGEEEKEEEEEEGRRERSKSTFRRPLAASLEDVVTEGIYWSDQIEAMIPPGFAEEQMKSWRRLVESSKVVRVQEGCGRMQNRRLTLEDAHQACARYRVNTDQMQGEVFSYYLARLLGIRNVAPAVLTSAAPSSDPRWSAVDAAVMAAQWSADKPVVLTPWMEQLRPVFIPRELRRAGSRDSTGNIDSAAIIHPSPDLLANRTLGDLVILSQWSDLLLFDYLTANVDRLVNNMFNLKWNSDMMNSPTHNLESTGGGPGGGGGEEEEPQLLVFLDNESGLFHSYRLLDKYAHYHETLLGALCVFRASTARALEQLRATGNAGEQLMALYRREEPLHWMLPAMPETNRKQLQQRIEKVVDQIRRCRSRYARPPPGS